MNAKVIFVAIMFCMSLPVQAETVPKRTAQDKRFLVVPYTTDVIPLKARIGRMLEIEFSEAEGQDKIDFAMGDRDAWSVVIQGKTMFLKPKAAFADTNLRIITNKRKYWIDLALAKDAKEVVPYHLGFIYEPDPPPPPPAPVVPSPAELAAIQAEKDKLEIEARLGMDESKPTKEELDETVKLNGDYGLIGPDELMPTSVADNGELTVITFAPNHPMPSVFVKEPDGSEAVVDFHVENDMLIVHRVARKLVLRHGKLVACLINGNFNPTGSNSKTHTISKEVRREVRVTGE